MRENGGELPVTYAAGLMTFPEPLRLIARPRRRRSRCSSRASLAGSGWKTSSVNFRFDAAMPVAATAAAASDGENGERGAVTFSVTAVTSHSGCSSFGPKIFVFRLGN